MPYKNYADAQAHWKRYYKEHRQKVLNRMSARYKGYAPRGLGRAEYWKAFAEQAKKDAFLAYGDGTCICCGESNWKFLTLDHVNGGGRKHRKKTAHGLAGWMFYAWLRRHNWPKDVALQVMCYNCNCGRARNKGICPHKE